MNTLPPSSRIEAEAAAWFARLNARTVSVTDLERFREWRAAPIHRAAYEAVERLWRESGALAPDPDVAEAAARAARRPKRRLSPVWAAAAAAAAVLAVGGGAIWLSTRPPVHTTAVGERRVLQLADGSELQLDADSRVVVRIDAHRRDLDLQRGRALFRVARDPDRPFRVRAGDATVVATGTRFVVGRVGSETRVTLVEGGVRVESAGRAGREWRLAAGEQIVTGAATPPRPEPANLARATDWTSGRLVFDAVPLAEAVAEINRYSTRPIRLADGVDGRVPISGAFEAGDDLAFAEAVAALYGLETTAGARGAVIGPPAKK